MPKLPSSFVELLQTVTQQQASGYWELRKNADAFDNFFEAEISEFFDNEDKIIRETDDLTKDFPPDACYGEPSEWENEPGFIPDIIDFSEIICFAIAGDGAPFCFDSRDNSEMPSIIYWEDAYWRRVAPNFEAFMDLFIYVERKSE